MLSLCGPLVCNLCNGMRLDAPSTARSHYLGRAHEKRVAAWLEVRNSAVFLLLIDYYVGTTITKHVSFQNWSKETGKRAPVRRSRNLPDSFGLPALQDEEFCDLCQLHLTSQIVALAHYQVSGHQANLRLLLHGTIQSLFETGQDPCQE